jgi:serine/threonine-protein kinase
VGDPTVQLEGGATDIDATEIGTQAASPKALADAAAHTSSHEAKPSLWPTSSHKTPLAADALDKSDLARSRMFHVFGITAPLGALVLSILIGGDPIARLAFWIGASLLALCNMGLLWLTSSPERYSARAVGVLWIISTLVIQTAVPYFGPFSAVVMVDMLGIVFIAIGRVRWTALATAGVCIGGHLACAIPVIAGWIPDVGVMSSGLAGRSQLLVAEILIVSFLWSGYMLGRWARRTSATALAELQSAMRIIGDREQVLAEVVDAAGPDGAGAAVKLLTARATGSSSLVERFHREMEIAARLESPHIVKVLEVSAPDAPVPYIAMERLHGTDLATRLRNEHRMPSDELVVLLDQVARGLEVARLAGIVHRDLKPHNLFHHDGATWKILDFGVSKVMDSEGTLTGEGIVGTPQYMAPEQASGGNVTHLADVYALGAIAYRCLTGRSPFKGKDLPELVYQVVHAPPQRPSTLGRVSSVMDDVLAVAMAKDPRKRFPSALSFAQAFVAARRGKPLAIAVPDNAWV